MFTRKIIAAIALAAGIVGFGNAANAQNVNINGQIAGNCTVSISQTAATGGAPLDLTVAQNLKIATITENCNDPDGYTLTMSSANDGDLGGADVDNATLIAYQVTYSGDGRNGAQSTQAIANAGTDFVRLVHSQGPQDNDFIFVAAANPTAPADTYTDTITITVTATP